MSEMKMSDVTCDVTFVDYVANAVKSHDTLVELVELLRCDRDNLEKENEELRNTIAEIVENKNLHYVLDWAICGIATNSSNGTEGREMRMEKFCEFKKSLRKAHSKLRGDDPDSVSLNF